MCVCSLCVLLQPAYPQTLFCYLIVVPSTWRPCDSFQVTDMEGSGWGGQLFLLGRCSVLVDAAAVVIVVMHGNV